MINNEFNAAGTNEPYFMGWVYLVVFGLASFLGSLCWAHAGMIMIRLGVRIRTTMISSIFRKTLKLSTAGSDGLDTGNVLTLMSNDTQRLVDTFQWVNLGIVAPATAIVIIALLINLIGAYALIGVAVLIVLFPFVSFFFCEFLFF